MSNHKKIQEFVGIKKKKYILKRKDIINISNQSLHKRNISNYFCKIAFSREFDREKHYEIKKILNSKQTNKPYLCDNFLTTMKIMCCFERFSKLFSFNVISDKTPSKKESYEFYKNPRKKNNGQFYKLINFFILTKFLMIKKKDFCTTTKIRVIGSKIFI
jgi:hypothetical protein